MKKFDVMFHLGGEQNLPNLLAMKAIPAKRHYIAVTEKTAQRSGYLKEFAGPGVVETILFGNAYDFAVIARVIRSRAEDSGGDSFAFNITGGTKIMSLAAIEVARALGAAYFYVDTSGRQILCWNWSVSRLPLSRPYLGIDDFLRASGHKPERVSRDPVASQTATDFVYAVRYLYHDLQRELNRTLKFKRINYSEANAKISAVEFSTLFPLYSRKDSGCYIDYSAEGRIMICIGNESCELEIHDSYQKVLHWLAGGWFEEYVYFRLAQYLDSGDISELRLGVRVDWRENMSCNQGKVKQEIDIVFTDGIELWLMEVKTGRISQDDFNRLENNCSAFAGVLSCGILVSLWKKDAKGDPEILERSRGAFSVAMINGNVDSLLSKDKIFKLQPGQILEC